MDFSIKRSYASSLVLLGFLISACGEKPEEEVVVENIDIPPQVTITLYSNLELDFSLDPDPQLESSGNNPDEPEESSSEFINEVYARPRRSSLLSARSEKIPEFKTDKKYQSLKRYEKIDPEEYAITIQKSPEKPLGQIRKTVKVQDKPLVFAERGFNISTFEKENKPAIGVDYATHLVANPPDTSDLEFPEHLDISTEYSRDTKYLVYNATRSAFGKMPPSLPEKQPEPMRRSESALPLERNPDSVLLIPRGKESLLVLRKAEKQLDLLAGNESLNKKQFQASKVP